MFVAQYDRYIVCAFCRHLHVVMMCCRDVARSEVLSVGIATRVNASRLWCTHLALNMHLIHTCLWFVFRPGMTHARPDSRSPGWLQLQKKSGWGTRHDLWMIVRLPMSLFARQQIAKLNFLAEETLLSVGCNHTTCIAELWGRDVCDKTYLSPCPADWYAFNGGLSCSAPSNYAGPCLPVLHGLLDATVEEKMAVEKKCNFLWPCIGVIPAFGTRVLPWSHCLACRQARCMHQ